LLGAHTEPHRDYLAAIAIFVSGAKGHSAPQLSRDLDCEYKTAFVLAHKLREVMASEVHNPDLPELSGTVEVDGMQYVVCEIARSAALTERSITPHE
jgi:hypothetical protein